MAETINDGGPAFPRQGYYHDDFTRGMSLRDYFAAAIIQGFVVNAKANSQEQLPEFMRLLAKCAYELADNMLAEREKARGE